MTYRLFSMQETQLIKDGIPNDTLLDRGVEDLWPRLHENYPVNMESAELHHILPTVDEKGSVYLTRVRELWKSKIGVNPVFDREGLARFKSAVIESQSTSTHSCLILGILGSDGKQLP